MGQARVLCRTRLCILAHKTVSEMVSVNAWVLLYYYGQFTQSHNRMPTDAAASLLNTRKRNPSGLECANTETTHNWLNCDVSLQRCSLLDPKMAAQYLHTCQLHIPPSDTNRGHHLHPTAGGPLPSHRAQIEYQNATIQHFEISNSDQIRV